MKRRTLWSDIHDHWYGIVLVCLFVGTIVLTASLDDPSYYQDPSTCRVTDHHICD